MLNPHLLSFRSLFVCLITDAAALIAAEPAYAVPIAYGQSIAVNITLSDRVEFSFVAAAGDSVVMRVGDGNPWNLVDGRVEVYGPDGKLLAGGSSGSLAVVTFVVTNAGPHTIIVSDEGGDGTGT